MIFTLLIGIYNTVLCFLFPACRGRHAAHCRINPKTPLYRMYVQKTALKQYSCTYVCCGHFIIDEGSVALLKLLTHICTISRSVQIDIKVVYQGTVAISHSAMCKSIDYQTI